MKDQEETEKNKHSVKGFEVEATFLQCWLVCGEMFVGRMSAVAVRRQEKHLVGSCERLGLRSCEKQP